MEELLELLSAGYPSVNFEEEKQLVTNGILDSVDVVSIISEIEDAFDVTISMEYINPTNFDSMEAMWAMIEELQ